ncbi:MAG: hypothetical protein ABJB55_07760 [Actinomycetota bacterium]
MDDAFSLVAARMPRSRRITAFGIRITAMLTVVVVLIAGFAAFVMDQQHIADRRRAGLVVTQQAAAQKQAQTIAESTAGDEASAPSGLVAGLLDRQARAAAEQALATASEIAASSSYDEARPAALAAHNQDLVFVDGPSTAPSIVSVYNGAAGWAAAVRGANNTCYWVAVTPAGPTRYGTGPACTGMAALAADRPTW